MKRILGEGWSLPTIDAQNRPFFTNGKVTLQQCNTCQHIQHPPEDVCQACLSFDLGWFESAGEGRIESVAIAHHPVHPALKDKVPYAIVVVTVDDARNVMIIGNAFGVAIDDIRIGDRVRAAFEEVKDEKSGEQLRIPQWEVIR